MAYVVLDLAGPPCSWCMAPIFDGWYAKRHCTGQRPGPKVGVAYTDSRSSRPEELLLLVCRRCAQRNYPEDYVDDDGNLNEQAGRFIYSGLIHELPTAAVEHHLQRRADKAGEGMAEMNCLLPLTPIKEDDEDEGDKKLAEDNAFTVKEEVDELEEDATASPSLTLGAKPKGVAKKKVRRGHRVAKSIEKQGKALLEL